MSIDGTSIPMRALAPYLLLEKRLALGLKSLGRKGW
jgi:hypothetical protein